MGGARGAREQPIGNTRSSRRKGRPGSSEAVKKQCGGSEREVLVGDRQEGHGRGEEPLGKVVSLKKRPPNRHIRYFLGVAANKLPRRQKKRLRADQPRLPEPTLARRRVVADDSIRLTLSSYVDTHEFAVMYRTCH